MKYIIKYVLEKSSFCNLKENLLNEFIKNATVCCLKMEDISVCSFSKCISMVHYHIGR